MKNTTKHVIGIAIILLIALVSWAIIDTRGTDNNLGIEEYQKGNYDKAIEYFTVIHFYDSPFGQAENELFC